jgi:hypothetical protein
MSPCRCLSGVGRVKIQTPPLTTSVVLGGVEPGKGPCAWVQYSSQTGARTAFTALIVPTEFGRRDRGPPRVEVAEISDSCNRSDRDGSLSGQTGDVAETDSFPDGWRVAGQLLRGGVGIRAVTKLPWHAFLVLSTDTPTWRRRIAMPSRSTAIGCQRIRIVTRFRAPVADKQPWPVAMPNFAALRYPVLCPEHEACILMTVLLPLGALPAFCLSLGS